MRRIHTAGIAFTLLLAVLLGQVSLAGTPDAGVTDGGHRSIRKHRPVADAGPAALATPKTASDPCAELNARPQLSPAEHQRLYGCPPCPCACVNGEIRCAPCAACESFGRKDEASPFDP